MQKPFQGITFCPTALPEEVSRSVSRKIIKLGGAFSKDLTKLVNVLVVGSTNTNKYRFAAQHRADIVLTDVEAIDSLYDLWLTGEDVTMKDHSNFAQIVSPRDRMVSVLRERFQVGALKDFVVFIGRVDDDHAGEASIEKLEQMCVSQNVHSCNSRHFVKESYWNRPTVFVTDCARGARVDAARQQGLPIVHPKWILDCHRRQALLDFSYYLLEDATDRPWDAVGKTSCSCWEDVLRRDEPVESDVPQETRPNHQTVLNKFGSDGDRLWKSVIHKEKKKTPSSAVEVPESKAVTETVPLFSGIQCHLHAFPQRHHEILRKIIEGNGGDCFNYDPTKIPSNAAYLVVPSNMLIEDLPISDPFKAVVTEFYFERCLHYKKLLETDPWSVPFLTNFKLQAPRDLAEHGHAKDSLKVAITGFQGVELLHITKILGYLTPMGLHLTETLNKDTDVLIINLGALTSIPDSHALWNNNYAYMFSENKKIEQNQVFRNSMKRKIEFIKQKHSIPVVTPGFIMELFARSAKNKGTNKTRAKLFLNDINWCVLCPRGSKEQFCCELILEPGSKQPSAAEVENSLPTKIPPISLKEKRQELLEKLSRTPVNRKRPNPVNETRLPPQHRSLPPKVPKLAPVEKMMAVQRSSSWGKMMSEHVRQTDNIEGNETGSETDHEDSIHTQVTYGAISERKETKVPSRRLTRQHAKQIDTEI